MSFDPVIELSLGNRMVDVTTDATGRGDSIRITRGQANEATKVSPSTCEFELNNKLGKYSPRNPVGPYYGKFERNTPVRVCTREIADTFTRTVVNGWGSTDAGYAWSLAGSGGTVQNSDWQVTGTYGTHSLPVLTSSRRSYLDGQNFYDVDVAVTVTVPFVVTGDSISVANILIRGVVGPVYYRANVSIDEFQTIYLGLGTGGLSPSDLVLENYSGSNFIGEYTTGQPMRVRMQIEGQTIRAKAWMVADGEPDTWFAQAHDAAFSAAGYVGVETSVGSGNTNALPLVVQYDDFEVRVPRFSGELSALPPRWDNTGNAAWVPVEAAGVMRRLSRNDAPVYPAIRRQIMLGTSEVPPDFYWPLDDASGVGEGREVRAISEPFKFPPGTQNRFGQGQLGGWLPPTVALQNGDVFTARALSNLFFDWYIEYARAGGIGSDDTVTLTNYAGFNATDNFKIRCDGTGGGTITITFPDTSTSGFAVPYLFDGAPHSIRFSNEYDSGDLDYTLYIDGDVITSGTFFGYGLTNVLQVDFTCAGTNNVQTAIGHVVLADPFFAAPAADHYNALIGWAGETAGARIRRLCHEGVDERQEYIYADAVPIDFVGDRAKTAKMGPQRPLSFMTLLQECADADKGILYEPRATPGLTYRTRRSLYNQTAIRVFDYTAGQLAPPFEPTDDDQLTVNDVLVKRIDGGEYRASQTTGPLSTDSIGLYRTEQTFNVYSDDQLPGLAGWIRHLGTIDEARYPRIGVNRARRAIESNPALSRQVLDFNIGDRLTIQNLTSLNIYGDVSQLVFGYEETLDIFQHILTFTCGPETPYRVHQLSASFVGGKIDSKDSKLHIGVSSVATTLMVDVGGPSSSFSLGVNGTPWTTNGAEMPIPITINGEDMLITAVTSGPTFISKGTVAHGVNASVTPGMPAGAQEGDLLLLIAAIRDTAAQVNEPEAEGYTELGYTNSHFNLYGKIHTGAGEVAPTVTFTTAVANSDTSAQLAAFRYVTTDFVGSNRQSNASTQNIVTASEVLNVETRDLLIIYYGWKQDDWTSVATIGAAGTVEIDEPDTTTGNDQGLVWDYRIVNNALPFSTLGSQTFTVTGGAAAISEGGVLGFVPRVQIFTVTRAVNGVVKSHAAGSKVQLTRPATLAL